ncbi:ATP-binding protein [Streptomyces marianii]|uniref:ATP-binding protein n=1 Tax=Streptomyces marianii TaxID=1817406 RepID=UPI001F1C744A|nr:ATP-binding protein [Streptomyces marianii]
MSCSLDYRAHPAPADLRAALHRALGLGGEAPADPGIADTLVRRALAVRPRIVVVEGADRLSTSCFEYVRFLHDDLPQGLCVVLIAQARGERSLRAQRMLASRSAGWPYIWPLTRDQVLQAVVALHPLWQSVAPGDLQGLDARFADGCLRRWVVLTLHTQRALAATGAKKPERGRLQAGGRCFPGLAAALSGSGVSDSAASGRGPSHAAVAGAFRPGGAGAPLVLIASGQLRWDKKPHG